MLGVPVVRMLPIHMHAPWVAHLQVSAYAPCKTFAHAMLGVAVALDLAAAVYYAATSPALTTIAHVLAVVMGMVTDRMIASRYFQPHSTHEKL